MPETREINLGEFSIGSTDRFRATITKDGVAWDLSAGTVTLTFEKPDRSTQFTRAMVAEDASGGVFYYDSTTDEIDTVGWWTCQVRVTDGSVVKRYPYEIGFFVVDEP